MANNDHTLNLEENSKYRVAFDLMEKVHTYEDRSFDNPEEARKYFFDLYQQSFRVVYNNKTYDEVVSKKDKPPHYEGATQVNKYW